MGARILIVDDERDLADATAFHLRADGFEVATAGTGHAALKAAVQDPIPDVILLDLMLPDIRGEEVCRQLRANPKTQGTAVIMVSAKGQEIDRVVGFEVGADDYVVKPFSARELTLRIRSVLRRASPNEPSAPGATVHQGTLRLDHDQHRVWNKESEVTLTALEFRLLSLLMQRRGRVQSRDQLLEEVWGMSPDITTRTVDTHVKRLRQKLGTAADYIETLRGVGYRFSVPD